MFSFKKVVSPAVTVLVMALLLPAGAFAEEPAVKADAKPAAKSDAKPAAKATAKPAAKSGKSAAKSAAKPAAKADATPAKAEVKVAAKDEAKEPAKETPKDQAKEKAQEPAKVEADPNQPMMRVNGTIITRHEMNRALKVMLAQNQVQQPLEPEVMKQAEAAVLDQLAAAELLYQEAAKLTVADLDKQIADKMQQNRAKFKSETEFTEALKSVDMTTQDMKDFTRKDLLIGNFVEQRFAGKATVADDEVRKFYDDNLTTYFTKPESLHASHILIAADQKASPEEHKKAKERAEAILKRIKAGEDFAVLAKSDSSCPSSAQGGDLGSFGRGQMVRPFEDAALALKPGEVSGVVETEFGYHIIKLIEKQEQVVEKFEQVKEKVADFLKRQKVQQQLGSYVEELKKTAKIEKL